ncbi:MAG: hypothetical protein ACYDCK_10750 [Thermoplasmatota archaeon]
MRTRLKDADVARHRYTMNVTKFGDNEWVRAVVDVLADPLGVRVAAFDARYESDDV